MAWHIAILFIRQPTLAYSVSLYLLIRHNLCKLQRLCFICHSLQCRINHRNSLLRDIYYNIVVYRCSEMEPFSMIVGLVCIYVCGGGGVVPEDLDIWAGCAAPCFNICTVEYQ